MSPGSEGSDIPRLECMIGLEIHVTHFQRLVRELHSDHISPFFFTGAGGIWLHKALSFLFFYSRGNVLHAGKQMCVCACVYVCMRWLSSTSACVRACVFVYVCAAVGFKAWSKKYRLHVFLSKPRVYKLECVCRLWLELWVWKEIGFICFICAF